MASPADPQGSRRRRPAPRPATLVLLVRHGSTPSTGKVLPGRAAGLHLSDEGRRQASVVAERLSQWVGRTARQSSTGRNVAGAWKAITSVYSSPLERTRETAAPIAKTLGLGVTVDRGLLECDFGEWTGEELKSLVRLPEWATVQRYPSGFSFPGGESFVGMQARIVSTLSTLCARHPGEAVVAVSHADPIKAAVAEALGSHLDMFQRIVISPCSVTAVAYGAVGPTVLSVNSTSALTDLIPS